MPWNKDFLNPAKPVGSKRAPIGRYAAKVALSNDTLSGSWV